MGKVIEFKRVDKNGVSVQKGMVVQLNQPVKRCSKAVMEAIGPTIRCGDIQYQIVGVEIYPLASDVINPSEKIGLRVIEVTHD